MQYLRKIKKNNWYGELPWLKDSDIQADSLNDLRTTDNELSVFSIGEDDSLIERIVSALASKCDYVTKIDFVLINDEDLDSADIKKSQTPGDTPDEFVNKLHYSLSELSLNKVVSLADKINTRTKTRIPERKVKELLKFALLEGQIDISNVKLTEGELSILLPPKTIE